MPVPESFRRIERPKNTIVYDNGQDGPKRYAVRERKSVKYVPGGNPQPQNGKVIGHIIGDSFVPLPPASDNEYWVHTLPMVLKEMEILGLSIPAPKLEPKRRGRPPKCPDVNS